MVGFHPADSGSNPDASTFRKSITAFDYSVMQKAKVLILSDVFLRYILPQLRDIFFEGSVILLLYYRPRINLRTDYLR